ncbi:hypothetical protein PGJ_00009630 [Porphyromonas gingivalis AJW4]|nr:hypothetical protein PGJ_00009630 [Porphyromonas gingivalis AJW4]ALO29730.1 hypothetical protein PGS_00010130 [Porphyromonas gingivalis A7A1-28]
MDKTIFTTLFIIRADRLRRSFTRNLDYFCLANT